MPPSPSRSPLSAASIPNIDESHLPKGQCRYILMIPELRGQRCGCMGFDHNKSRPGATCQCGHLSCFHVAVADSVSPSQNKEEIDLIKQRVQVIEDQTRQNENDRVIDGVSRVSNLEETVDRYRDEAAAEIKGAYRNVHSVWQLFEQLQSRMKSLEDLCRAQGEYMAKTGNDVNELRNRQLELLDSDESLEERVQKLESSEVLLSPPHDAEPGELSLGPRRLSTFNVTGQGLSSASSIDMISHCTPTTTTGWTVHVSLMPFKEQPFPFEKDTIAYKRSLSRGLHRMVAVEGTDAKSFNDAVSRSFESILKGRPWMPLEAKLCDAEKLQGLPMLRQLEPHLVHGQYDMDFLRKHCAVCTPNGKVDSLYITMVNDPLSWNSLRRSPLYLDGLESAWEQDPFLDNKKDSHDSNKTSNGYEKSEGSPSAGDIVAPFTSLKRAVSEISCPSDLDDNEGSRKLARTCKSDLIELRRGVETAQ